MIPGSEQSKSEIYILLCLHFDFDSVALFSNLQILYGGKIPTFYISTYFRQSILDLK